jgi:hypothetical protein
MGQVHPGAPHTLVRLLRDRFNITTFVETGTYLGQTTRWAASVFAKVVTIEMSPQVHAQVLPQLQQLDNVTSLLGNSADLLPQVLRQCKGPVLFWLDAHYSGGITGGETNECPLLEELRTIVNADIGPYILIDDARFFVQPPPPPHDAEQWPALPDIIDVLRTRESRPYLALVEDIILAVPEAAKSAIADYTRLPAHLRVPLRSSPSLAQRVASVVRPCMGKAATSGERSTRTASRPAGNAPSDQRSLLRRSVAALPGVRILHRAALQATARKAVTAEFEQFRAMAAADDRFPPPSWADRLLMLNDRSKQTEFDAHYIYHTAWAARILEQLKPAEHVDVASSLYFIGMVSAFLPVTFYDYRPAPLQLSNLKSLPGDLLALPLADGTVQSLSCMHVLEHIGLGRYGDPLDTLADRKAMAELSRVLAPGGNLLVATPVGRPTVRFNAHRIYSARQIVDAFADLQLRQFSLIPDDAVRRGMINNAPLEAADAQAYGCGCFWFQRAT